MSIARQHADWLSLLDISGPFLSLPVLQSSRGFPQGLENVSSEIRADLRAAYTHWLDERERVPAIHHRWVRWILSGPLELDDSLLAEGPRIPAGLERQLPEHHETLRPDLVLLSPDGKPALLIHVHPPGQDLAKPLRGTLWKASPDTRMAELLRGTGVSLGLVTNGERWMLVHAPPRETAGYVSWYADLWTQEPVTLRAFVSLLRQGRFFGVGENERLPALLRDSAQDQAEVTDQLGAQVRAAVQVLVQAFDRLDTESGHKLLAGVDERALYEAALTVMMRLVFLLAAEEKKLIGSEYEAYQRNYAVGSILDDLQEKADRHGEEILERTSDAWCRLLAVFRAVHGGVQHENVRLPAYGGTLFDPDRFPFLEGRAPATKWKVNAAQPLGVNNRVVLHLLRALQFLEIKLPGGGDIAARRLSFRGLDIEQIGHVYEGLLDHTARRANEIVLGLGASKNGIVTLPLERLETLAAESREKLVEFLVDETERGESAIRNALSGNGGKPRRGRNKTADAQLDLLGSNESATGQSEISHALLAACDHDPRIAVRVAPFAALLRDDTFGRPLVILPGSLYVAPGNDRRSTGTHYTPRSLTEPIVQYTLEPLVYHGPAEGLPRDQWRLKTPRELLALKICDLAMGSGAFLVATCRYLSARLVEAWAEVERAHPDAFITSPEGDLSTGDPSEALLARLPDDERLHLAARAVADRCLYGVDINPMAVEMAKLSLWLITVDRERPFTFLDHALKCGDSLLGISHVRQLERFSLREGPAIQTLFDTINLFRTIESAAELRRRLEATPSHTAAQLVEKARLHAEAETLLAKLRAAADFLVSAELDWPGDRGWENRREVAASHMQAAWKKDLPEFQRLAREGLRGRHPFHWPLEFPEVFESGENDARPAGFNALVGNPPFMGGQKITGELGADYRALIVNRISFGRKGSADLSVFFLLRCANLLNSPGMTGLVLTSAIAEGDNREVGLEHLHSHHIAVIRAETSKPWPGAATVTYSGLWARRGSWAGKFVLNDVVEKGITPNLTPLGTVVGKPLRLKANGGKSFIGHYVLGMGFLVEPQEAQALIEQDPSNRDVLFPFLNGSELNATWNSAPTRWVINFRQWPLSRKAAPDYTGPVAEDYPDCLDIIRRLVKPERDGNNRDRRRERWWLFGDYAPTLEEAMDKDKLLFAISMTAAKHIAFCQVERGVLLSHMLAVLAIDSWAEFGVVSCSLHDAWTRVYTSYNLALPRYIHTDCFLTFPFPSVRSSLESIGERYHEHRRQLMQTRGEGLTKTYNRFHTPPPEETSADIAELRALHRQLDVAVAAAYGWADLAASDGAALGHDFHETKQGLRFTLAPAARREVLDRLLALNHQRHAEEVAAGLHEKKKPKTTRKPKIAAAPVPVTQELLLEFDPPAYTAPTAPAGKRFAAPREDFRANVLRGILAAAGGSLSFEVLRDAFVLASRPALMVDMAMPEDAELVGVWAKRWNELIEPRDFLPALQRLGSKNLLVFDGPGGIIIALDGNMNPALPKEAAYDGWLAHRVAKLLAPDNISLEDVECSIKDVREALAA